MPEFAGKVLLLGNYPPDRQESMQRFAQIFATELPKRGIQTELIRPEPIFGRFTRDKWFGYVDKYILFPFRLRKRLRTFRPEDALHVCDHSNALYNPSAAYFQRLVTCHDILAIRCAMDEFPENPTGAGGRYLQRRILAKLMRARRVICVSEATLEDFRKITERFGGRPCRSASLIHNGFSYPFTPMERSKAVDMVAENSGVGRSKFILHVGGNQWYKNRVGAARIHQELIKRNPTSPDLLFVGKELPAEIKRQPRVHSLVHCENEMLRACYSAADALLFPSLAEGFGWPIIEAQACGCLVAASNRRPMMDIGGNAAMYFDPDKSADAAEKLERLLNMSEWERDEHKMSGFENIKRFDTERMIDRYIEEYAQLGL